MELIHVLNKIIISSGVMSSDITSESLNINEVKGFAMQAVWSGATGASSSDLILIQGSCDGSNWSTVDTKNLGGATSGSLLVNIDRPHYSYMRVFYDKVNTTAGSLTVTVNMKQ